MTGEDVTYEEGVRLGCRVFVLFLMFWLVTDLVYLPREVLTLVHEYQAATMPRDHMSAEYVMSVVYYLRLAIMSLAENVLRIAPWSAAALWFYRGGPMIERFLGYSGENASGTEQ